MADNYLEFAMEDFRNKSGAPMRRPKTSFRRINRHVYIRSLDMDNLEPVRALIRQGVKVSFSFPDGHRGAKLARTLRCHYRPESMGIPEGAEILEQYEET